MDGSWILPSHQQHWDHLRSWLVFEPSQPQRITYIRAKNKLQSMSKLFIPQVIKQQATSLFFIFFSLFIFRGHSTRDLLPAGWPFSFCGPTQELVLATANTGKLGSGFGKKNAGEWTRRVEISKEEIPGSKRSMHGNNTDLLQALKGECTHSKSTR